MCLALPHSDVLNYTDQFWIGFSNLYNYPVHQVVAEEQGDLGQVSSGVAKHTFLFQGTCVDVSMLSPLLQHV